MYSRRIFKSSKNTEKLQNRSNAIHNCSETFEKAFQNCIWKRWREWYVGCNELWIYERFNSSLLSIFHYNLHLQQIEAWINLSEPSVGLINRARLNCSSFRQKSFAHLFCIYISLHSYFFLMFYNAMINGCKYTRLLNGTQWLLIVEL